MEEEVASGINPIMIVVIIFGVAFAGIVIAYMALRKKMTNSDVKRINELRSGTSEKKFDTEIIYQKLYVRYLKTNRMARLKTTSNIRANVHSLLPRSSSTNNPKSQFTRMDAIMMNTNFGSPHE